MSKDWKDELWDNLEPDETGMESAYGSVLALQDELPEKKKETDLGF